MYLSGQILPAQGRPGDARSNYLASGGLLMSFLKTKYNVGHFGAYFCFWAYIWFQAYFLSGVMLWFWGIPKNYETTEKILAGTLRVIPHF